MTVNDVAEATVDIDALFKAQFRRIARVIARVTRDPARAEELAVEVFLKWSRTPGARGPHAVGWLYRTAVRTGLNDLRGETRRRWYERLFVSAPAQRSQASTPEDLHATNEAREHVRAVLGSLSHRQAALLVLRSDGLTYAEISAALRLNPASVGALLARAEAAFYKEYVRRYGDS
jgi:RNA polymerase sigma-70 factor (ECF subfamily)